ncbi:hypothetical protein BDQ12DRAFT_682278 [Crucibulum laeve]|uniref:Uncharacterized protein n=1 Tax=Crucibulum laeve TaxID=68775 RepID=A0A5C3M461_9AGAR|nr:hypothetical protein BDQ12DRAFT_682278 [Crucibulum laeve]
MDSVGEPKSIALVELGQLSWWINRTEHPSREILDVIMTPLDDVCVGRAGRAPLVGELIVWQWLRTSRSVLLQRSLGLRARKQRGPICSFGIGIPVRWRRRGIGWRLDGLGDEFALSKMGPETKEQPAGESHVGGVIDSTACSRATSSESNSFWKSTPIPT